MESTPPKNIENISVQLHLSNRNKHSNSQHKSKLKIQPKFTPLTTIKHQRNLSPWNRKKDQIRERNNSINDEPNLQVISLLQKQSENNIKNQANSFDQTIMKDFLKKIHFTNKNKNSNIKIPPFEYNNFQQNSTKNQLESQKPSHSHNIINLTEEQIRKIIIYPKNQKGKKRKNNEVQAKKMASIQNFYDPYQNKTKMSKKMLKYKLKLNDDLSQTNQTRANDSNVSYPDFQITWRKNSMPDKIHRRNFSMPENEIRESKTFHTQDQNEMRKTFFKIKKNEGLSKTFKTEPTQRDQIIQDNPQKDFTERQTNSVHFEPTYATPSGQAIKRIKHQYKKSRRMKTGDYKSQRVKSQSQPSTKQNNFYLYRTFLNYKNKKNSNGMNITKTLGFNFHNQQTFQQNIEKIWLKSKN